MREQARRAQCVNNLLQLGIAMGIYASTHSVLPPGVVNDDGPIVSLPVGYHHGWTVQILPFMDQGNVYRRFDVDASIYAPSNDTARSVTIATFLCASSGWARNGSISYAGCHHDVEAPIAADNHGVLYLNSHVRFDDITDGLTQTILLGEVKSNDPLLTWASGTRATLRNTGAGLNSENPMMALYYRIAGSAKPRDRQQQPKWSKMGRSRSILWADSRAGIPMGRISLSAMAQYASSRTRSTSESITFWATVPMASC